MKKYYATKGDIPRQGEVWLPVGDKAHLVMLHLIDIEQVRTFIPEDLKIKAILPGKTLGLVFMTSMGPESTLPYHEFIIAPAFVKAKNKIGFYVTHIFVDNKLSQIGGLKDFGLDKKLADFTWNWEHGKDGFISVTQDGHKIFSIKYTAQFGRLPMQIRGGVFSILQDKLIWCNNIFKANFGLTKVKYAVSPGTSFHDDMQKIGLKKPLFSIMGEKMRGYMGDDTQVVAFLPDK